MRSPLHEGGSAFSARSTIYWSRIETIFRAIVDGDDALGIPPYNGGLFEAGAAPILSRSKLPDAVMAEVIFCLSHQEAEPRSKYINYRDLSVQQLGSIYEGILEYSVEAKPDGSVGPVEDATARKDSGSYYTPEELVGLIIDKAVGPLVYEKQGVFITKVEALTSDRRHKRERLKELELLDPAARLLDIKVCDPAMGSGHFLVSFVDWLADRVLTAMATAAITVKAAGWADTPYISPLAVRIAAIRDTILEQARTHKWPIVERQLDDRHIVRRMILKRVVYGVDKNPMAVELAKVALWLHSFTVGAPLSFLDHHLRCGDSILGAWVRPTVDWINKFNPLYASEQIAHVEQIAGLMSEIETITDNDIAEVAVSKAKFSSVEEVVEPIANFFSLVEAEKILQILDNAPARVREPASEIAKRGGTAKQIEQAREAEVAFDRAAAFRLVLEGAVGDPIAISSGKVSIATEEMRRQLSLLPEQVATQISLFPGIRPDDRRRLLADNLVRQARMLAARHRFFHWEISFPNVWQHLLNDRPDGGFDAVIGNPPYVRQELLGEIKPALKKAYVAFNGVADLYVYFYEQGLRLLRPGGRMAYVVTNKWLKAGYAENVRRMFSECGWVEFVADFGHAKRFFPDADVFPSVICVRKPTNETGPETTEVCVIPREEVPDVGLGAAVTKASYRIARGEFGREGWTLEPPAIMALLAKMRASGITLAEYATAKPVNGIKTGFNEAFLISAAKRDELVSMDPACGPIIKPYLRGQDIDRWYAPNTGLFMIVMKSSSDHPWPWADSPDETEAERVFRQTFPSLHAHFKLFESFADPKTGRLRGLRVREDVGRYWWELRPCAYYDLFTKPRIAYQAIQYYPSYALETEHRLGNNKTYFIDSSDPFLIACLNSPIMWWYSWRHFIHMKDEALSNDQVKAVLLPIPHKPGLSDSARSAVHDICAAKAQISATHRAITDWLRHEFGLRKLPTKLMEATTMDADSFVTAVREALPKGTALSATQIARLRKEHADTIEPGRLATTRVLTLERQLSDLVNTAYCLTPEDVQLMWRTAPPRMPFQPSS